MLFKRLPFTPLTIPLQQPSTPCMLNHLFYARMSVSLGNIYLRSDRSWDGTWFPFPLLSLWQWPSYIHWCAHEFPHLRWRWRLSYSWYSTFPWLNLHSIGHSTQASESFNCFPSVPASTRLLSRHKIPYRGAYSKYHDMRQDKTRHSRQLMPSMPRIFPLFLVSIL